MAKASIATNLLGRRVTIKPGFNNKGAEHGDNGIVAAVFQGKESSIFGNLLVLIEFPDGCLDEFYATTMVVNPEGASK